MFLTDFLTQMASSMDIHRLLEWTGSLLSVAGAYANAVGQPSRAYFFWIPSAVLLVLFSTLTGHWGLLLMQSVFLFLNLKGSAYWRSRTKRSERERSLFGYTD